MQADQKCLFILAGLSKTFWLKAHSEDGNFLGKDVKRILISNFSTKSFLFGGLK